MSLTAKQEDAVRAAAAARLADLGRTVAAGDLRLSTLSVEGVRGLTLFRAAYGGEEDAALIQGSVTDGGVVNTLANDALVGVWRRWLADAGRLPDPAVVTRTSLFLLSGDDHRTVVLADRDRELVTNDPGDRAKVRLPRLLDDGRQGVVFWMSRQQDLSEITLVLDDDMIDLVERTADQVG